MIELNHKYNVHNRVKLPAANASQIDDFPENVFPIMHALIGHGGKYGATALG